MKRSYLTLIAGLVVLASCKNAPETKAEEPAETKEVVTETPAEENDWIVLFDGTSTDAWHAYGKADDEFPESWKIEDGALVFYPVEGQRDDIVTDAKFESFLLHIEWKISEAGNSGIMWAVQEMEEYAEPYHTGPEIQVLDNEKHPDAQVNGKLHQAGALYDMVEPAQDVCSPVGEWNTFEIEVNYNTETGKVTHNGTVITEFGLNDKEWSEMVSNSKFDGWPHFAADRNGKIALQDHDNIVAYRNIKIRKL